MWCFANPFLTYIRLKTVENIFKGYNLMGVGTLHWGTYLTCKYLHSVLIYTFFYIYLLGH